jgi:hypothetical protein
MALSEEATQRFVDYVEHGDMTDTTFGHDDALLAFAAWALVHDPTALRSTFAFEGIMTEHGVNENKMRYVHAVLGVALPLIETYERARSLQ